MKKTYSMPEAEMLEMKAADVIATSNGNLVNGEDGNTGKIIDLTEEGKEYWS